MRRSRFPRLRPLPELCPPAWLPLEFAQQTGPTLCLKRCAPGGAPVSGSHSRVGGRLARVLTACRLGESTSDAHGQAFRPYWESQKTNFQPFITSQRNIEHETVNASTDRRSVKSAHRNACSARPRQGGHSVFPELSAARFAQEGRTGQSRRLQKKAHSDRSLHLARRGVSGRWLRIKSSPYT